MDTKKSTQKKRAEFKKLIATKNTEILVYIDESEIDNTKVSVLV